MSLQDQFKHGRIPIKPLSYSNRNVAQRGEFMIDNAGNNPSYHLFVVDPEDEQKIIDITAYFINEAFGNSITVNIDGVEEPISLHDFLNFLYRRFLFPDNIDGFDYNRDREKVLDPETKVVLLKDIDDIHYLPITRVDTIFDENGNTLQEILDSMTHIGFLTEYIQVVEEGQYIFEITYPFVNYTENGNYFELRCGTVILDKSRYQVIENFDENNNAYGATITFFTERFERNRRIDILYMYNARGVLPGFMALDGNQLAYHSVSSSKLEKVVNDYITPDETAIVSAKAIYDLNNEFIRGLEDASNAVVYAIDTSSTTNRITIDIRPNNITLGAKYIVANILTKTSKTSSVTLEVLHGTNSTKNHTLSIPNSVGANRMIRVLMNLNTVKLLGAGEHNIVVNRYIYTCADQEVDIPFSSLVYNRNSFIKVYRNGVRLFEDLDYTKNNTTEKIHLMVRTEEGERIVFEAESVEF